MQPVEWPCDGWRLARQQERALEQARRAFASWPSDRESKQRFRDLSRMLPERAPSLLTDRYARAIGLLAHAPWQRKLKQFTPPSGTCGEIWAALCTHLLEVYPCPPVLWTAFTGRFSRHLVPIALAVAGGESLYALLHAGRLAIPLTRRQCHLVLHGPAEADLLRTMRAAQVRSEGGSEDLVRAWIALPPAMQLHSPSLERFWYGAMQLLARGKLETLEVAPLVAFIGHQKLQTPDYSVSGRSVAALQREQAAWLRERMAPVACHYGYPDSFQSSGFVGGQYVHGTDAPGQRLYYRVGEITTSLELLREGQAMGHCVYSYGSAIVRGVTSIWSLVVGAPASSPVRLTIEVDNARRAVVQLRGLCNRAPTSLERELVLRWANDNGLRMSV